MTREEQRDMACTNWICSQENGTVIKARSVWKAAVEWADSHPRWIPVEEELPKEKQKVLVYMPADERCDHEYMCEALYNYAWHGWEDADEPIELEGITHWMPLPEAPRKED